MRKDGKLVPVSWDEALGLAAEKLSGNAKKIGVTRTVKRATGLLCLQDAMVIVKSAGPDCKVKACMTREEAERIKQQLEAFEATAEIKVTSPGEACANPHPYPEG